MTARQNGRMQGDGPTVELLGDLDRPHAWMLLVDGTPQSHVDLDDPLYLEFEYMRRLGHVVDLAGPPGRPLRVLHLGAGGLTLARYVAATRPRSAQLAAEASAEVADLVRRRLPLNQPSRARTPVGRIRVRVADARVLLEHAAPASFDVIVADVFAGAHTPAHLTSAEFTALAARALAPSGTYAVNVGYGPPLAHARASIATIGSVFGHVCVIAEGPVLRGRRFGNLVVVAAGHELPVAELTRRAARDPFPARVVDGDELDRFVAGARPITDAAAAPSPAPPPSVFADRRRPGRARPDTGRQALLSRHRPQQGGIRAMRTFASLDEFIAAKGEDLGHSEWHEITQEQVNAFADATGDHQWIHVDAERAAGGPFGTTIAHGYLTLSLLPVFMTETFRIENLTMGINYGLDRVRFPAPVPVGSKIRARAALTEVRQTERGVLATIRITVEVEGQARAACIADSLSLFVG